MASMHARLVAGVLVIGAAGLLLLGGVTYGEQRSFQLKRVDQQIHAAQGPVRADLERRGVLPDAGHDEGHRGGSGPGGGGSGEPPLGGDPDDGPPPGTYGQLRDARGRILGSTLLANGQTITARPSLPSKVSPGKAITVGAQKGSKARYRVRVTTLAGTSDLLVIAVPLHGVEQTLHRLLLVEGLVIAGVLLAMGAAAWLVVRIGLRPLDRIGLTAGRIAGGDLSHRAESTDPRTEVGRLGGAFNSMLDRLEVAFAQRRASEERLRQFLADASHELRTPLASIRGYAELYEMGAARDPAEVEKAMRRIEDEATRMGVLVEDLLALARLDEVAEAPHVEVDLGALARDAADDAGVTAPDRRIEASSDGPAHVLGDPHQLHQVLANLLRNALIHTPAGTPIDVAVTNGAREVSVAIRDHGPGLPPGVHPATLFERFWRSEGGRERGRSGAGLGLAIVSGIVAAHGGRVEADNAPGGGAVFTVHLPAA
jgi:two-component system OmpR family sensor kinase